VSSPNCTDVATNDTDWLELNVWIYSNTIVFTEPHTITSFSLFDLTGKKLYNEQNVQDINEVALVTEGCYILQVQTAGQSYSQIVYLNE